MAVNQVNIVNFRLQTDDPGFGYSFNHKCDNFVQTILPQIIDEELARYGSSDAYMHIDLLEVEVGKLQPEDFFRQYPQRFRQSLRQALEARLALPIDEGRRDHLREDEWWQAWLHFMQSGRLPWHISAHVASISALFSLIVRHMASDLVAYLRAYGHLNNVQQRLVYQLEDDEISQLVGLLQPAEREFIAAYVRALVVRYRQVPDPEVSAVDYRHTVWLVVLSYLLTDRSSFFDKKNFVRWTIARLAAKFNTSYAFLLSQLVADIDSYLRSNPNPELMLILGDLQKNAIGVESIRPHRNLLVKVLADPDSCHRYIANLSERAIKSMVYIVVESKRDADFVVSYASYLDTHREAMLGQRAGRDFRKVKWRIIFPLILQRSVTTLDQRWVVRSVLTRIAAHYNLHVLQILDWVQPLLADFPVDPYIRQIVSEWHDEIRGEKSPLSTAPDGAKQRSSRSEITAPLDDGAGERYLDESERYVDKALPLAQRIILSGVDVKLWRSWLSDSQKRLQALKQLDEQGRQELLVHLYPDEQQFISAYAVTLEELALGGVVRPVNISSWQVIKWSFLYGVLIETERQVFNKKHIIRRVLDRLAAHYNVRFEALIAHLRVQMPSTLRGFSYDVVSAIHDLHDEIVGRGVSSAAEDMKRLVKKHYAGLAVAAPSLHDRPVTSSFLSMVEKLISIEVKLFSRLKRVWGARYPRQEWLDYLIKLAESTKGWSVEQAINRLLAMLMSSVLTAADERALYEALEGVAAKEPLLHRYMRDHERPQVQATAVLRPPDDMADADPHYIYNAGLVMLAPFMPRLFAAAGLLDDSKRQFRDRDSQIYGIFLLQYAVFGEGAFPEYELELNKLLTGFRTGVPIPKEIALGEAHKNLVMGMLGGVLQHWEKLRHSSVDALRESFLRRDGRLIKTDETMQLNVAAKAFDMLLDTLPWKFNVIRHPWMDHGIYVTWR